MTLTPAELAALARVNAAARAAHEDGNAPFAAAILRGDTVLSETVNEVHKAHDPSRHAEIVAIAAACRDAGAPELPGATLVSSCQPCEMCLTAARFAKIDRLLFSARQESVRGRFFMFPGLTLSDYRAAGADFDWDGGRLEDEVIALYRPADA